MPLSEKEIEALNEVKSAIDKKADSENTISKEDAKALVEEHLKSTVSAEEYKALKSDTEKLAGELKAIKEQPEEAKEVTSFKSAIADTLEGIKNSLKGLKSNGQGSIKLEIKAPDTMTVTGNIVGEDNVLPEPVLLPGVIETTLGIPFIDQDIDTFPVGSSVINWVEEKNDDGDAAFTGEGLAKAQIDFDLKTYVSTAKKVTDFIKVSKEMLDDIPFMASQISNKLRKRHDLKRENGILFGDAGVDPNSYNGITTQASAFIPGGYALAVPNPTLQDVIVASASQIISASDGEYMPDTVYVNPTDFGLMITDKATDGHYIVAPFQTEDGSVVNNLRIVVKTQIPVGQYLIGDMSKAHLGIYEAFTLDIGFVNDDFTKNLVTILGESRTHFFIAEEERKAFVYDSIATAKTAIEKV